MYCELGKDPLLLNQKILDTGGSLISRTNFCVLKVCYEDIQGFHVMIVGFSISKKN